MAPPRIPESVARDRATRDGDRGLDGARGVDSEGDPVADGVSEGGVSGSDSARLPAACRVPDYAEFRAGRVPFGPLTINLALAKSA